MIQVRDVSRVYRRGADACGTCAHCTRVAAGGRARRVALTVGKDFGDQIQVTDGLAGGELLIVGDPPPLRDGQPVTVAAAR